MAETRKQMHVEVADEVGKLAEVTAMVKQAGVNILALWACSHHDRGFLAMITDDNTKACSAIASAVEKCEEKDAVCVMVPNEVGALSAAAGKLGEAGIQIDLAYVTSGDGANVMVVLETADNAKAAELL